MNSIPITYLHAAIAALQTDDRAECHRMLALVEIHIGPAIEHAHVQTSSHAPSQRVAVMQFPPMSTTDDNFYRWPR